MFKSFLWYLLEPFISSSAYLDNANEIQHRVAKRRFKSNQLFQSNLRSETPGLGSHVEANRNVGLSSDGFRIQGFRFRVQGSGFVIRVQSYGSRVQGLGFRVQCRESRVEG